MWRRLLIASRIKNLTLGAGGCSCRSAFGPARLLDSAPISASASHFLRKFSSFESENNAVKKKVEDIMPIATGHEREELEAEIQGRQLLDINYPVGPFGTKEAPAVVKSYYDKRIVGCPGGEGEDEHDVQTLYGFGWRKAKHMNAQFAHSTLCLKWWDLEGRQMDTMMIITN